MNPAVWRRRLAAAIAFVFVLVAAVPISDNVLKDMLSPVAHAQTGGGIRAASIADAGDANEALARIEKLSETSQVQLPPYFEGEIGLVDGAHDVRVDGTGRVVGFLVDDSSPEVFACVRANMSKAGWTGVSLGKAEGATFVKAGGLCTWALVTCTQVGSATAVVYRCVVR